MRDPLRPAKQPVCGEHGCDHEHRADGGHDVTSICKRCIGRARARPGKIVEVSHPVRSVPSGSRMARNARAGPGLKDGRLPGAFRAGAMEHARPRDHAPERPVVPPALHRVGLALCPRRLHPPFRGATAGPAKHSAEDRPAFRESKGRAVPILAVDKTGHRSLPGIPLGLRSGSRRVSLPKADTSKLSGNQGPSQRAERGGFEPRRAENRSRRKTLETLSVSGA